MIREIEGYRKSELSYACHKKVMDQMIKAVEMNIRLPWVKNASRHECVNIIPLSITKRDSRLQVLIDRERDRGPKLER